VKPYIDNKIILITGGTGTFGKQFVKTCLTKYKPKRLIVFSRDELKQFEMRNEISDTRLDFFIGDIRDKNRLSRALKANVDVVVHAAALKQVPAAERNPFEAIKTNVMGSQNVIDCAIDTKTVRRVLALSTDKAASPVNLYGATKLAADKLFIAADNYRGEKNIKFSIVRYGNVLGSRGSVVPYFLEQKKKGVLTITDKRMTRFSLTVEDGVNFSLKCLESMKGKELFIPRIPSYHITDVAKAVAPKAKIKITGIREGEKIHEELITATDSLCTGI
jgi:UDP-N-acetylglucosamine 4,6-dehydratase (inverting)